MPLQNIIVTVTIDGGGGFTGLIALTAEIHLGLCWTVVFTYVIDAQRWGLEVGSVSGIPGVRFVESKFFRQKVNFEMVSEPRVQIWCLKVTSRQKLTL